MPEGYISSDSRRNALIFVDQSAQLGKADPGGIGMGGDAGQMHPARGDLNKEEHIERLQPHGLHTEEVTGYNAGGLVGQELLPRGAVSSRDGRQTVATKPRADGGRRDQDAELLQLALNPQVAQRGFSSASRRTSVVTSARTLGLPGRRLCR
jgi:hypothetical protein